MSPTVFVTLFSLISVRSYPTERDPLLSGASPTISLPTIAFDHLNTIPDNCELGAVFKHCTAGATTNGCTPSMSSTGAPSASAGVGFVIFGAGVEGRKQALLYYGVNGPSAQVWAPGSSSFKCVKQPVQRVPSQNSGGSVNTCSGPFALDFSNYLASKPSALGNPAVAGEVFNAQLWFRDPPAPSTSNLSNALQFTMAP